MRYHLLDQPAEQAQGLVEYALVLMLVAIVVIAILSVFGTQVEVLYLIVEALDPFN